MKKFFKQKILKKKPSQQEQQNHQIVMMESNTLGMTVIQQDTSNNANIIEALTAQQWVQIISEETLDGVPYSRVYFSFLKGLPQCLRMKIWLFLVKDRQNYDYQVNPNNQQGEIPFNIKKSKSKQRQQNKLIETKNNHNILKARLSNRSSFKGLFDLTSQQYLKLSLSKPTNKQYQQIQKDIHRSFSGRQKYIYTQQILRRILYAISNWGIQYSQGMNYILLNVIIFCLQSLNLDEKSYERLTPQLQKEMFIIMVGIISQLQQTFGNNNIFKVMDDLQQKIAYSCPQTLFLIYKHGMDCFSCFSQYYYSVMSYNDPPEDFCKNMMDLFFLEGQKAIHSMVVRMLQIAQKQISQLKDPEQLQSFMKKDIFLVCYRTFKQNQESAQKLQDFGMSFYNNIQKI